MNLDQDDLLSRLRDFLRGWGGVWILIMVIMFGVLWLAGEWAKS